MKIKHLCCISCGQITIFHTPVWGEVVWHRYDLTRWYPKKKSQEQLHGPRYNVPPPQLLAAWKTVTIFILNGQKKTSFSTGVMKNHPSCTIFSGNFSPNDLVDGASSFYLQKNDSLLIKKTPFSWKRRPKLTSCKIRIFAAASKQGIKIAVWPTWRHRDRKSVV